MICFNFFFLHFERKNMFDELFLFNNKSKAFEVNNKVDFIQQNLYQRLLDQVLQKSINQVPWIMLLTRRSMQYISHLYFDPQSQKLLTHYKSLSNGPYNLPLKFIKTKQPPTLFNKIFLDRQLSSRFQYLMAFLNDCSRNNPEKNKKQFPRIEENFMSKVQSFIKSRPQQITVHECQVGRAFFVEERKIYGAFMHRKLNLAKSCYSTEWIDKSRELKYRMKGKLSRSQDIRQMQKIKSIYEQERYSQIYQDTYEGFHQTEFITRSLIKIVADLKIEIKVPQLEQSIRLGYEGPSEHIMQMQSYKVPYQEEEWVISDVDFFMEGNYYFLKDKN